MRRADSENAVSQPWESLIGSPFFVSCRYRRISVKGFSVADSPNNRNWESKSLFVGGLPTPKTQAPLIEQIARNTAPMRAKKLPSMRHGSDLAANPLPFGAVTQRPPRLPSRRQSDQRADSPRAHRALQGCPWKYSSLFSAIAERLRRAVFPSSADWCCSRAPSILR